MWFAKVYDPLQAGSIDGTDVTPHDNAIKRAQRAHYDPPKNLATDPEKTIFVGRLNFETTEGGLRNYFERYGAVKHVRLIHNLVTGISQGYGFITFDHEHSARAAYDKANHAVLDDHVILVDYERSRGMKGWIPRRFGGGFGGKKESGQLRFGARDKPFRWPITSHNDPNLNISHDQKRSDNWRSRTSNRSPPRSSSRRRRSRSPRRRDQSSSRHHERSRHRYRDERERRDRSPRRYYKDDRSSGSRYRDRHSPRRRH